MDPMRISGARWAWLLAGSFLVATVVTILVALNITTAAPSIADDASLPDIIFANFTAAREAWPQEMAAGILFALGFLVVAVLGVNLRGILGRSDPRATRLIVLFLIAGTVGILSQIVYFGIKEVATAPYYCDCDYLAEELISRGSLVDAAAGMQAWMIDGFSFLFSAGLLALAGLAAAAAWPAAFVRITQGLAVLGLASVAWNRIGVTLLVNADVHLDYPLIGLAILAVIAGIAVPLWAAMLARTLSRDPIDDNRVPGTPALYSAPNALTREQ